MNTKEFYDHITQHMTPEEALMKLLEGHVLTYEKLKFNEGEELHPAMVVSMAALDMGWNIAIPDNKGDEDMELIGMAIGTPEYFEELFSADDSEGYDDCDMCDDTCSCDRENRDEELLLEALDLLQYFVDRVEAGTIRSQTTYKKYKDFLDNINQK